MAGGSATPGRRRVVKERVEIDVDKSPGAEAEISETLRELDKIEKEALDAQKELERAKRASKGAGRGAGRGGTRGGAALGFAAGAVAKDRLRFTSEGAQFGVAKLTRDGFRLEGVASGFVQARTGVAAKIGGGVIAANVFAGVYRGLASVKGRVENNGEEPATAVGNALVNRAVDVLRTPFSLLGVETIVASGLTLFDVDRDYDSASARVNSWFEALKNPFGGEARRRAQVREDLRAARAKRKFDNELHDRLAMSEHYERGRRLADAHFQARALVESWTDDLDVRSKLERKLRRLGEQSVEEQIFNERKERRWTIVQAMRTGRGE